MTTDTPDRLKKEDLAAPRLVDDATDAPSSTPLEPGPREDQTGKILAAKFQLTAFVGSGGMSEVYKARHVITGKAVAVKILHQKRARDEMTVRRLKQEAKTAGALTHNNIVGVHDMEFDDGGTPFLVMDFIEGQSLAETLKNDGPLPLQRFLKIMEQVASALDHAQKQNVVHRDLKPSNIMISSVGEKEQAKIVDFGIAKMINDDVDTFNRLTQTGETFGSPLYMSPEQCTGTPVDPRSDIYSFGCVMYEALSGAPPHNGETVFDTINRHINSPPPELKAPQIGDDAVRKRLEGIILKCLAKSPRDRYQTSAQVEAELRKLDQATGSSALSYIENAWNLVQAKQAARRKTSIPILVSTLLIMSALSIISSIWTVVNVADLYRSYKTAVTADRARFEYLKAYVNMTQVYELATEYVKTRDPVALVEFRKKRAKVRKNFDAIKELCQDEPSMLKLYSDTGDAFEMGAEKFVETIGNLPPDKEVSFFRITPGMKALVHQTTKLQSMLVEAQGEQQRQLDSVTNKVAITEQHLSFTAGFALVSNGLVFITLIFYLLRMRAQLQREKKQITQSVMKSE